MNDTDTMIEAMSQFGISRPILRSSVWPRRHRQVSCTGPPGATGNEIERFPEELVAPLAESKPPLTLEDLGL